MKTIWFGDREVPVLGQGTWYMGEKPQKRAAEIAALRRGVELGLTVIDTAEMYGSGRSESLVGEAIRGIREQIYLVSKVLPSNASAEGVVRSCEASLRRLGTDALDLYLLHWRGRYALADTLAGFERLREQGKIRDWGVSNFDVDDMEELLALPSGGACVANQVLYNPENRGIEFDLLPWCQQQRIGVMAYSPVGQGGELLQSAALRKVAQKHGVTPAQVALAWCLRQSLQAIPKAGSVAHVEENAAAAELKLDDDDLRTIDGAFAPPKKKMRLAML
ncbi:aldo/keto reductase [Terriglobus aquaticus]|uniref:Aldo/keto reductase n=1 Tax=Terriglobus aquaticus TaxID=940139 RepID=A0ABW9KFD5_9BACT|nr:aldo/keto reductase [Terriglobus aquaticus]